MSLVPEPEALVQQIAAAVADLNWVSETDAPFDVMQWTEPSTTKLSAKQVLTQAHLPPDTPVESQDLNAFFEPALPQSWHTAEEKVIAEQFQTLQALLHQTLRDLEVFRCGKIEIDIYIVGRSQEDDWIVLHTAAVET
jgi:Nuclease A inhibitor-like protein